MKYSTSLAPRPFSSNGEVAFILCQQVDFSDSSDSDSSPSYNSSQGGYQGQVWQESVQRGDPLWTADVENEWHRIFDIRSIPVEQLIAQVAAEKFRGGGFAHPVRDEIFRRAELAGLKASQVRFDSASLEIIALYI